MVNRAVNIVTLRSKLPAVGTNIFTVMSKLATDTGAINLSQGFPDFDCDPALVDAVARHMRNGLNQYAPMQGVAALRQAIAAKYAHYYRAAYDPDAEVTVTSGGTEAIYAADAAVDDQHAAQPHRVDRHRRRCRSADHARPALGVLHPQRRGLRAHHL